MQINKKNVKKETNQDLVRGIAIDLLYLDISDTGHPLVASHPFTDSWYSYFNKEMIDLHIQDNLSKWREEEKKVIKKLPASILFSMICKPYRMTFLKYAAPYMSSSDIGTNLRDIWKSVENISGDVNVSPSEMVQLFRSSDKNTLMTKEELSIYIKMPSTITVYRGVTSFNKKKERAMSWTTNLDTAKWFSKRYGKEGEVWVAEVEKKDVLAIFDDGEKEIVLTPKNRTKKIVE